MPKKEPQVRQGQAMHTLNQARTRVRAQITVVSSSEVRVTLFIVICLSDYFCQNRAEVPGSWLALRAFQRWAGRLRGIPQSIAAASPAQPRRPFWQPCKITIQTASHSKQGFSSTVAICRSSNNKSLQIQPRARNHISANLALAASHRRHGWGQSHHLGPSHHMTREL